MSKQKKITVFLTDVRQIKPRHFELISPERAEKARRFRMPDDQKRSVAAGMLLQRLLPGAEIITNEYGKPKAKGDTQFNLTHSGRYAAIALGDCEVGVDLEAVRPVNTLRMGKVVFCEREMELLRKSSDRLGYFFDLWTKKEALLKCMGRGFHRSAKSVDVSGDRFDEDGVTYYFKTYRFADYTLSVCAVKNDFARHTERIHI